MADSGSLDQVRAIKAHAMAVFSELADVVGIGITTFESGYGLKINLRALPKSPAELPDQVDGIPVKVEVVGSIRKRKRKAE